MQPPDLHDLTVNSPNAIDTPGVPACRNFTEPCQKLLDTVPRSRLLSWAKLDLDHGLAVAAATPALIERLSVANVNELVGELATPTWNANYRSGVGKEASGAIMYMWLQQLGVNLPPAAGKSDYANLITELKKACGKVRRDRDNARKPALPFLCAALPKKWRDAATPPTANLSTPGVAVAPSPAAMADPPVTESSAAAAGRSPLGDRTNHDPTDQTNRFTPADHAKLRGALERAERRCEELMCELREEERRHADTLAELHLEQDRHDVTGAECDRLRKRATAAEERLDMRVNRIGFWRDLRDEASRKLAEAEATAKESAQQLQEQMRAAEQLGARCLELLGVRDHLELQLSTAQEQVTTSQKAVHKAERGEQKAEEQARKRCSELSSLLEVERSNAVDLKERVTIAQTSARSTAVPLRNAQRTLAEVQDKLDKLQRMRMSDGRVISQLQQIVDAQPALELRDQTARQLGSALEAARTEASAAMKGMAHARAAANDAALHRQGPRVVPLQANADSPYDPFVAEMMRRLVSEGKVAKQNVGAVWAIVYSGITRAVPSEMYIPNAAYVDQAFHKLGAMDAEDLAAELAKDLHSWAIASDTGNRKTLSQYDGAMELMSLTRWRGKRGEKGEPFTSPLACKDLGNNQTARQGCAALLAAFERAKLQASKLSQVEGDSTEHAEQQRRKFITALEQLGLQAGRAIAENCYRHLTVLEEKAVMEAAYPGAEVVNFMRMIHEVRAHTPSLPLPFLSSPPPSRAAGLMSGATPLPSPPPPSHGVIPRHSADPPPACLVPWLRCSMHSPSTTAASGKRASYRWVSSSSSSPCRSQPMPSGRLWPTVHGSS